MLWSAFILGFIGSMHCAGMCGPIALAIRTSSPNQIYFFLSRLTYNLGRVITYSVLGLLAGSFGAAVSMAGFQQALSIALGVMLLLTSISLIPVFNKKLFSFFQPLTEKVTRVLANILKVANGNYLIVVGLLNGLLPCGLVYTALAGAAVSSTALNGATYMLLFGAGTLPMMFAISLSGKIIPLSLRSKITRAYPYVTFVVAVLLILRGMNLGIPMISPQISEGAAVCCHK